MLASGLHDVPPGHLATVVTYLEMTAPAPQSGAPLPPGLTFAPLDADLPAYRALFRRIGEDWLWQSRLAMPDAELEEILGHPAVTLHTMLSDGQPEALLELDFREDGACELAFFGLSPALIGRGAGRFLIDRAIELAWARDIARFHVHTCTLDSPAALSFYRRAGFEPVRQQVEIMPDPRRTGLLPPIAAPGVPML